MNNEETIISQPQKEVEKTQQSNMASANETNGNGKGKMAATVAASSFVGAAAGGAAAYAADSVLGDKPEEQPEEVKPEEEQQEPVAEEPQKPAESKPAEEHKPEPEAKEEVAEAVETDYTGHNNADPMADDPNVHTALDGNSGENEVQVLGVYEAQGDYGQTMHAAVLTDGEDVAAVFDFDGDNQADVLAVDVNHNQQIDEGEVIDISDQQIQMEPIEQAYIAQQQEQMQQEQDTFAYNAGDEQTDYNNDVDFQDA